MLSRIGLVVGLALMAAVAHAAGDGLAWGTSVNAPDVWSLAGHGASSESREIVPGRFDAVIHWLLGAPVRGAFGYLGDVKGSGLQYVDRSHSPPFFAHLLVDSERTSYVFYKGRLAMTVRDMDPKDYAFTKAKMTADLGLGEAFRGQVPTGTVKRTSYHQQDLRDVEGVLFIKDGLRAYLLKVSHDHGTHVAVLSSSDKAWDRMRADIASTVTDEAGGQL